MSFLEAIHHWWNQESLRVRRFHRRVPKKDIYIPFHKIDHPQNLHPNQQICSNSFFLIEFQFPNLPFLDFKGRLIEIKVTMESITRIRILRCILKISVWLTNICPWIFLICFVIYYQIFSETWPIYRTVNCPLWLDKLKLIIVSQREYKGLLWVVIDEFAFRAIPSQGSESPNFFIEIRLANN